MRMCSGVCPTPPRGHESAFELFHLERAKPARADTLALGAINWPLQLSG